MAIVDLDVAALEVLGAYNLDPDVATINCDLGRALLFAGHVDEAGAPGLHFPFWHGLWAPKGTPKDIVAKVNAAVVEAFADPAVRKSSDRADIAEPADFE